MESGKRTINSNFNYNFLSGLRVTVHLSNKEKITGIVKCGFANTLVVMEHFEDEGWGEGDREIIIPIQSIVFLVPHRESGRAKQ